MKEFVKKKAVIVKDRLGLPNYMTMFYMEPGTYEPEDVPELFKIRNKIVPAVLVSQFTNTMIKGVPASLPYQQPKHTISYDEAAAACGRKGKGWHLMTNTEFVYLLHEAEELGHTIGGNTNYGSNSKNEQESGVRYDSAGRTLTGCDPLTWSHDGTADGVFGLCGNFWEWVTGLRLHKGVVEYTPNNDAAVEGYTEKPDWTVAEVNGRPLKLYGNSAGDVVMSVAEEIEENWEGCHMADLQLEELDEVPEYGGRAYLEKRDYIMAKQKEQLAQQEKAVQKQTAQLENLKQENEKAQHQQVRRTTYQSLTLLSNDKKIQKQEKQLSELSQKIEDTENLLDEISAVAYDKAVAVVSENAVNDALKASTEQVDIYLDWLKEPGRTASKETLDYTTYQITTLRKNIIAAVNRITARLKTVLIKPEIKKPAIEQIKENTRPSVLQKLHQRQEEINQREQTCTKPKKRSHGMEL